MEVIYRKKKDGHQCESFADLGPGKDSFGHDGMRRLCVSTYKTPFRSGELQARASVSLHMGDHTIHAFGMGTGLGDYSRTIIRTGGRCTEKAVRALHAEALTKFDACMVEAKAHYARQDAERAKIAAAERADPTLTGIL